MGNNIGNSSVDQTVSVGSKLLTSVFNLSREIVQLSFPFRLTDSIGVFGNDFGRDAGECASPVTAEVVDFFIVTLVDPARPLGSSPVPVSFSPSFLLFW
jgi:hypothetical protein